MNPGEMSRKELEAFATEQGIADPEHYPNMKALREAIEGSVNVAPPLDAREGSEEPDASNGDATETPETAGTDDREDAEGAGEELEAELAEGMRRVRGTGPGHRVAFFERDARHPGGQVFLVGGRTAIAFETPDVIRALRDRRLEEV
jgi:hypothetical protein